MVSPHYQRHVRTGSYRSVTSESVDSPLLFHPQATKQEVQKLVEFHHLLGSKR